MITPNQSCLSAAIACALVLSACSLESVVSDKPIASITADAEAIVSKHCEAKPNCFRTIQGAVDQATGANYRIYVEPGDYQERVVINTANISVFGSGAESTRLHHNLVAQHAAGYHRDGWGTAGSATLTINAENVRVENLQIENSFDYLANDALRKDDPKRLRHPQAVAVLLDESSDKVAFINTRLDGYQDTLFVHGGRAYFKGGAISGNVDFIFGDGQVLFEDVEIIARKRSQPFNGSDPYAYITAPSTQVSDHYGLVFIACRLTREEGVPDGSYALGRPWHPTTTFEDGRYADPNAIGYAAFIDSHMDAHIFQKGWASMHGTARDGTKTDVFYPEDSRFYEQNSSGAGAAPLNKYASRRGFPTAVDSNRIRAAMIGDWFKP